VPNDFVVVLVVAFDDVGVGVGVVAPAGAGAVDADGGVSVAPAAALDVVDVGVVDAVFAAPAVAVKEVALYVHVHV